MLKLVKELDKICCEVRFEVVILRCCICGEVGAEPMEKLLSCFGDKMLDTRVRIVSLNGGICPGFKLNTGVENKGIRICNKNRKNISKTGTSRI